MYTKEEKFKMLSDLIQMAKVDKVVNADEGNFLAIIAERLGISPAEFQQLSTSVYEGQLPTSEIDRILQLHRLILLMNVDRETSPEEVNLVKQMALKMGLNPMSVNKILRLMNDYPNKVLPPEVLLSVFKESFN